MLTSAARSRLFGTGPGASLLHSSLYKRARIFSTGQVGKKNGAGRRERFLARAFKYVRIPVVVVSVYGLGYQMGLMDYATDPEKKEKNIMSAVLMSSGCKDPVKGALVARDGDWNQPDDRLRRVALVGAKIVHVAKAWTAKEEKDIKSKLVQGLPAEITSDNEKLQAALAGVSQFVPLAAAADMMEGKWSYVLLDSPAPNAFVTSVLPRKIFVTTAMMDKFIDNDDEMAMVLGHEVSHLILGHNRQRAMLETALSTFEIMLLSTLNAGGLGAMGLKAVLLLSTLKRWCGNAYSREYEREADELGIKLAAMSCFDTKRGAQVFRKMQLEEPKMDQPLLAIENTHPPTEERYAYLLKESNEENAAKYEETTCATVRTKFREAMKKPFY